MFRVTGEFEITLRTPITVSFEFDASRLDAICFEVDKHQVKLRPLEPKPAFTHEGEVIEGPSVEKLRIWITKDVGTLLGSPPNLRLSNQEHEKFEPIITEATRRFVTTVKRRTGQWHLDHRLPVYSYSPKYSYKDQVLPKQWPLEEGMSLVPKEAHGPIIAFDPSWFYGELSDDLWKQVAIDTEKPVILPHYEEAIFDAKTFLKNLRYDTAVLYAAFAAETILQELSVYLLKTKSGLTGKQVEIILKDKKMPSLIALVEALSGSELPRFNGEKLQALFNLRNKIAHKKKTTATSAEATGAIKTAEKLKAVLRDAP